MAKLKDGVLSKIIKLILVTLSTYFVKKLKTYVVRVSIALLFLILGTHYLIDSLISLISEYLGLNLEHLKLITGIALLIGGWIILKEI